MQNFKDQFKSKAATPWENRVGMVQKKSMFPPLDTENASFTMKPCRQVHLGRALLRRRRGGKGRQSGRVVAERRGKDSRLVSRSGNTGAYFSACRTCSLRVKQSSVGPLQAHLQLIVSTHPRRPPRPFSHLACTQNDRRTSVVHELRCKQASARYGSHPLAL